VACGFVGGGVGGAFVGGGGDAESTRSAALVLVQAFFLAECGLEWIFGESVEGGRCKSQYPLEDDGFVEAAEECDGVETEYCCYGSFGV